MKLLAIPFFVFIFSHLTAAQNTLDIIGLTSGQPANVAFSVRKLSSTYNGPLFRLRIASTPGSIYYDVYPDASPSQHLSMASKVSTVLNSFAAPIAPPTSASLSSLGITNAFVTIWYDQSGNANHLQNSDTAQLPSIIKDGSIITEGNYGMPFLKWLGALRNSNPKYLTLTRLISNNGQVIVVNKFDGDGFLLGDNNFFSLPEGEGGRYRWHSGPHLSPKRLFDENNWATPSIRNGAIYQNGIFRAGNLSTTYNQNLGINAVAPTGSHYNDTYWDNIGAERVGDCRCHFTSGDNSGYAELLSFPNSLSNSLRAAVENSQSAYFGIALISLTAPVVNPLIFNCSTPAPSSPTTFGVTGTGLTSAVTGTAPTGFEISENSGSGYTSSIALPISIGGSVSATLYLRLAAGFNAVSGNISAASTGATTQFAAISSTNAPAPAFSEAGAYFLCAEATYLATLTIANPFNGWSGSSNNLFTVNSLGYISALAAGTATLTYTDACGQSATKTVVIQPSTPSYPLTDNRTAYKFNGNPQGPSLDNATINYAGTEGFTYLSRTQPTAVGFYKANVQTGAQAGCPTRFYIFNCTTCNN